MEGLNTGTNGGKRGHDISYRPPSYPSKLKLAIIYNPTIFLSSVEIFRCILHVEIKLRTK